MLMFLLTLSQNTMYEGELVNWSQMDIKHKTCDIQTWGKKHLFLDTSSNIDTTCPITLPVH
jgi:hypothetical protein